MALFFSAPILLTKKIGNEFHQNEWNCTSGTRLSDVRLPCKILKSLNNVVPPYSLVLLKTFSVVSDRNPIQNSSLEKENLLAEIIEMSSAFRHGRIQGGTQVS